jgi:hypothetical protein
MKFSSKAWHPLFGNKYGAFYKVLFQQTKRKYKVMLVVIDKKLQEHVAAAEQRNGISNDRQNMHWQAPPWTVKVNCDAGMLQHLINTFVLL